MVRLGEKIKKINVLNSKLFIFIYITNIVNKMTMIFLYLSRFGRAGFLRDRTKRGLALVLGALTLTAH